MAKSKHDQEVEKIARQLANQGWNVQADHTSKFDTPDDIGKDKRVPDIVATKKGCTKIIEVDSGPGETPDQESTFRRSASQRERTSFGKIVLDPGKK